jgi:glycosyltransferase involved in cell wall biosynthesis
MSGIGVSIGLILSNGFPVPVHFVLGLMDLQHSILTGETNASLPPALKIDRLRVINAQGFPVDAARNEVCRAFLDDGTDDYLLFLDADMRHPRDLMWRLLRHQRDIVTGRYQMRRAPFHTVAMRKVGTGPHDYKAIEEQHGLAPIDAAGAGCLLITRKVLETLRTKSQLFAEDGEPTDEWFRYQVAANGLRSVSEDMFFFERAKAAGFTAWCDLDAVCSHVASVEITPEWQEPYLQAKNRIERSVLLPGERVQ